MTRGLWIWGVGVTAYAIAVMQRTTLGVSGLEAAAHFGVSPGILSTFVVVQLIVYAGMQIPSGMLLDRFGSRLMLTFGMVLVAGGQTLMALTSDLTLGFVARTVVGAGDAFLYSGVLRLLPVWFKSNWVPLLSQLTGLIGAGGQILSATGFVALMARFGWTPAFLIAAAISLGSGLACMAFVRDRPANCTEPNTAGLPLPGIAAQVSHVWRNPGTQLGLWTHLTTGFAAMVFAMMWGIPYLVEGEGVSPEVAGVYYSLLVAASVVLGPLIGVLTARHPLRRSNLVLTVIAANAIPWTAVVLWPGPAPTWLLVLLVLGMASGGPGSAIGMDYARTSVPQSQLGTANGIVIVGAFSAALVSIGTIGAILDWLSPHGQYSLTDFRVAFASQIPFWVFGTIGILVFRARLRRKMAEVGVIVPPWREALQREWLRHRYRGR